MGEGQHPSSASQKLRFVPKGLRISGPDADKARLKLRVFCREPAVVGKEGQFFSIVADRKYLLAGGVWASAYFGCFVFARSAFLGTSAVFP